MFYTFYTTAMRIIWLQIILFIISGIAQAQKSIDFTTVVSLNQSQAFLTNISFKTKVSSAYGLGLKYNWTLRKPKLELSLGSKIQITNHPFKIVGGPIFPTRQGINVNFKSHFIDFAILVGKRWQINKKIGIKIYAGLALMVFEPLPSLNKVSLQFDSTSFSMGSRQLVLNYVAEPRAAQRNVAFDAGLAIDFSLSSHLNLLFSFEPRIAFNQFLSYRINYEAFDKQTGNPVITSSIYESIYTGTGFNTHIGLRSYLFATKKR